MRLRYLVGIFELMRTHNPTAITANPPPPFPPVSSHASLPALSAAAFQASPDLNVPPTTVVKVG